jgi:hypothetical protein
MILVACCKTGCVKLTSACLRQFGQSEKRIVTWDLFKGNVAMPATLRALLTIRKVQELVLVYLFGLLRADDTNLVVATTKTATSIDDRVYVELRCLWLARKLTQSLGELLLKIVVQVILLPEEDDAALRD